MLNAAEEPPVLLPTHTCFDDALDTLEEFVKDAPQWVLKLRVVHAICHHPDDGHEFAHAWLEVDGQAIFDAVQDGVKRHWMTPVEEYYADLTPTEITRYTAREALALNYLTNHYGPWEDKYKRLCRPK